MILEAALSESSDIRLEVTDNVCLKIISENDVTDLYVAGLNDPEVNRYMTGVRLKRQSIDSVKNYVRMNSIDKNDRLFGIFVGEKLIGTVRIHDVDTSNHSGWIGIVIFDKSYWGSGLGTQSLKRVMVFCVQYLGLNQIHAGIYKSNEGSKKCFLSANFLHDPERDQENEHDQIQFWIYHAEHKESDLNYLGIKNGE